MHVGNDSITSDAIVIDIQAPTITLGANSDSNYAQIREVSITLEDNSSGLADGISINYGWSTSNSVAPVEYAAAVPEYDVGDLSAAFTALGADLDGDYYLWVVPTTFADVVGNTNSTTIVSTGTFKFDNDTITEPTISFESNVVTNGLIFGFDGKNNTGNGYSSSTSTWNNYGSSNTNGTINGPTWGDGYIEFDGVDDEVIINEYVTLTTFTTEAIVSINSYDSVNEYEILSNVQNGGMGLLMEYGKLGVSIYVNGSYTTILNDYAIELGQIYIVSGTYDGSTLKLYIDGILVKSASVSGTVGTPTGNTVFAIGCNPNASSCNKGYVNGRIYSSRIYNRALTESEIRQNYNADKLAIGRYVNGTPNFTITGGTSTLGISGYKYAINDFETYTTYNSNSKPTVTTDGENEISAKAVNNHSIEGVPTAENVYIDNTAPTGALEITTVEGSLLATVTATDALSGIREAYEYKVSTSDTCNSSTSGFIYSESNSYNFIITSAGEHYVCVRFQDNAGNYGYAIEQAPSTYIPETGNYETFTAPEDGYYYIETWGADGGTVLYNGESSSYVGGSGGYSSGYINLSQGDNLYVYVGGKGGDGITALTTATAGYNGGGTGAHDNKDNEVCGGGGGATDIRLTNGAWNDATSLNSRIMVAGGGGGGCDVKVGLDGGDLVNTKINADNFTAPIYTKSDQKSGYSFGIGQNGTLGAVNYPSSGGGGGYYGGIAPSSSSEYFSIAGGGTSFISGYAGSDAISSASDTANPRTHTNNTLHYSGKYFIDGSMIEYIDISLPAVNNTGDGKARITYVGDMPERINTALEDVRYIKDCVKGNDTNGWNAWSELQAIKDGENIAKGITVTGITASTQYGGPISYITDGIVTTDNYVNSAQGNTYVQECIELDLGDTYDLDEIAVWHYFADGRTYNNNVTYVSSDNSEWTPVIAEDSAESSLGKRVNAWEENYLDLTNVLIYDYSYTGNEQTFSTPISGYYKVETWGAQGASNGGKGGYSSGYIHLNENDNLYVQVGGVGGSSTSSSNNGGYNGGGAGGVNGNYYGFGGGGATDIRVSSGNWNDINSLIGRIMVAGGGGAGYTPTTSYTYVAGAGGGLIGSNGGGTYSNSNTAAADVTTGGTQITGGIANYATSLNGGFGYARQTVAGSFGGGGGGGYFSGANGYGKGGSGGSSYISGYAGTVNVDPLSYDCSGTVCTIGVDFASPHYSNKYFVNNSMVANTNTGAGKAKISYIGEEPTRINENLSGVRYIKDCINESTAAATNIWVEIQAMKDGTNLAKSKTVTGTVAENSSYPYSSIVDGDISIDSQGRSSVTGNQCVTVDLGDTYDLDEIAIWHYWTDGRTYNDNVTSTSTDGVEWNAVIQNTDAETSNGKRVNAWNYSIQTVYTINYYQGNGSTTNGATKIGTSTCNYGESCTLKTYAQLGATFPESSSSNNTSSNTCDHYWSFNGWSTSTSGTEIEYTNGEEFMYTNVRNLNLYAVGKKTFYFDTGQAPTTHNSVQSQYWNPYSRNTSNLTNITIPSYSAITGWTYLGYKGGSNSASSGVAYAASTSGNTVTPAYDTCAWMRSLYSRTLTINYQANGGSGTTSATTATQYYNSGYADGGSNHGGGVSTPTFTLRSNGFTSPTGKAFSKWADGSTSGTQYAAGASYTAWAPAVTNTTVSKNMYAIWRASQIHIQYSMNGGSWGGSTNTHLSTSGNWVTYDGNTNVQNVNYGGTINLANYNNSSYINITRSGYIGVSGSEWCTGSGGGGTCYNHNTDYTNAGTDATASTHFCDARHGDCTVKLYVHWQGAITCCWYDSVKHNRSCSGTWVRDGDYCFCYLYNQTSCPSGFGNQAVRCYNWLEGW